MSVEKFIKHELPTVKAMISNQLENEFDSHKFIKCFAKKFEPEYSQFLAKYNDNNHRTVHSQIATSLAKYADELGIKKEEDDVFSESVFGNDVPNKKWSKIK